MAGDSFPILLRRSNMKQLLAATLLVAVVAVTGCGDAKKPAAKTTTPATDNAGAPADKSATPTKQP
jgi:hypothetical protein